MKSPPDQTANVFLSVQEVAVYLGLSKILVFHPDGRGFAEPLSCALISFVHLVSHLCRWKAVPCKTVWVVIQRELCFKEVMWNDIKRDKLWCWMNGSFRGPSCRSLWLQVTSDKTDNENALRLTGRRRGPGVPSRIESNPESALWLRL